MKHLGPTLSVLSRRSGMVAMILLRTLHRDIATYNQAPTGPMGLVCQSTTLRNNLGPGTMMAPNCVNSPKFDAIYHIVRYKSVQHRYLCVFNRRTFCCPRRLHHSFHVSPCGGPDGGRGQRGNRWGPSEELSSEFLSHGNPD